MKPVWTKCNASNDRFNGILYPWLWRRVSRRAHCTTLEDSLVKLPRVIYETDLHNDCGLIAAAAWKYLTAHGVKARLLNIRYGPDSGHTVVVYECVKDRFCIYDHEGSLVLDTTVSWKTHPTALARAWARYMKAERVTKGKWI